MALSNPNLTSDAISKVIRETVIDIAAYSDGKHVKKLEYHINGSFYVMKVDDTMQCMSPNPDTAAEQFNQRWW